MGNIEVARKLARAMVPRPVRNWLRSPATSLQRLKEEIQHRVGLDPVVDIRPGFRLKTHPTAWRGAYHVHLDDPPQVAELDCFLRTCTPGMTLFDLGSHYGMFSLAAANAGGSAVAVDPSAHALQMTARVAKLNNVHSRITLVHAAAAATPGEIEMVDVGVQALGYFVQPDVSHGPRERTRVKTVSVDSLTETVGRAPTHVKIDVEGFEEEALKGAVRTLSGKQPPLVFMELHVKLMKGMDRNPAAPLELLAGKGYRFEWCEGGAATRAELLKTDLVRLVARKS